MSCASFFFFWNFSFFWTVRGVKGQRNGPRWQKKIVWSTSYLRNHVSYDCHLWYTYAKWWYLQVFVSFFSKFGFSGLLGGEVWKGKKWKNGSKWEKILPCSISQESYIIWFSFMLLIFKMIIPPGVFFTFSKFRFSFLLGG